MTVRKSTKELAVILQTHDLLVWTLRHTAKFPRSHRFGLGERIEVKLHQLMELLIAAKYASAKGDILKQAALRCEEFRFLLRLAQDLGILSHQSHGFAVTGLEEIGRQISGWRRSLDEASR